MTAYAPPTLLEHALALARAGYAIFPLAPGTKDRPLVKWRDAATKDEEQILQWWTNTPEANIGLPTGEINNLAVLDVDGDEGRASLHNLPVKLPFAHLVQTPRGNHRYFQWHPGLRNSAGKLGKGLDIRGDGGYVVAPGSKRPEGTYRGRRLGSEPLYPFPEGLIDLLTPKELRGIG